MQMEMANLIGLAGAIIAGIAYVPQIIHLIKEKCSAGISIGAYVLWFGSSILITISAFWLDSWAFRVLGIVQIVATGIICVFSVKYKGQVCPAHARGGAGT